MNLPEVLGFIYFVPKPAKTEQHAKSILPYPWLLCWNFLNFIFLQSLLCLGVASLLHFPLLVSSMLKFFFFFETEFRFCYPGWSAMARSQLTAISASWVQAILLPQPPEQLGLQACTTVPS